MNNTSAPQRNLEAVSLYNFDETLARVKQGLQAENMLLIHEINTQQIVKTAGIEINGFRQLLFFHPRFMKVILGVNPAGVVEAPLKFAVVEQDDHTVVIRYAHPGDLFSDYAGLDSLGSDLSTLVGKVLDTVTH